MKKIKWGNVFTLILFLCSVGFFLGDMVCLSIGMSLTWLGLFTGMANLTLLVITGVYIYGELYEE